MPIDSSLLRFADEGVAYLHLATPIGTYRQEADTLVSAATQLPTYAGHRVYYLTGHADMMFELRLRNFLAAFTLEYNSNVKGTDWIFCVPYLRLETDSTNTPADSFALNYVLHLRVARDIYQSHGVLVEQEVVRQVQSFLHGDLRGEILTGLGWADFIVAGTFESLDSIVDLIERIRNLTIAGSSVFRRVRTLIGYDYNIDLTRRTRMTVRPLLLARVAPTRTKQAAAMLLDTVGGDPRWDTMSVDGKWDIVLHPGGSIPLVDFILRHRDLAESAIAARHGLERLETHLLSEPFSAELEPIAAAVPRCNCHKQIRSWDSGQSALVQEIEPRSLRIAIHNTLSLLRSAARDSDSCCDVVPPLRRFELSLEHLLQQRAGAMRRMLEADMDPEHEQPNTSWWYRWVARTTDDIQDWCTYAEQIVRQRTAGRFEAAPLENAPVVTFPGGVQKLLYVADSLVNGYARKLRPNSSRALPLVCMHDSVDTVLSNRYAGVVRIPTKLLFVLPLGLHDLWHEVGVYAWHRMHSDPQATSPSGRMQRLDGMRFAAAGAGEGRARGTDIELALDLADVYADAMTLIHGFRADVTSFIASAASALFETTNFRIAPDSIRDQFLTYLLTRLCLAVECRVRADLVQKRRLTPLALTGWSLDQWEPHPRFLTEQLTRIVKSIQDDLLSWPRYRHIIISNRVLQRTIANLVQTVGQGFRGFLNDIAWSVKPYPAPRSPETKEAFMRIMGGYMVDLSAERVDIHDVFLQMHTEMVRSFRRLDADERYQSKLFAATAALIRSSIVCFNKLERESEDGESEPASLASLWS